MSRANNTPASDRKSRLASEAARLIAENGYTDRGDIERARRKAAARLGENDRRHWPDDDEIGRALRARPGRPPSENALQLETLRRTALTAMRSLEAFRPRLTGWLANGIALRHMPVELLLHADTAELVMIALIEQGIQFREGEHLLHFADRSRHAAPSFRFLVGGQAIELIIIDERRQRKGMPVDKHSRRPWPRIGRKRLEAMLADDARDGSRDSGASRDERQGRLTLHDDK